MKNLTILSKEEARDMAETAHKNALPTLIELADWRNQSGSSPRQIIPYNIREEAEKYRVP